MRWLALLLVLLHAGVLIGHDRAHIDLSVGLLVWQEAFIYPVIVVAPVVAAALIFTRHRTLGFVLLAVAMFGALVFGGVHHYLIVSPDHVSHLPPGDAQPLFRTTALLMMVTEALGVAVGGIGARAERSKKAQRSGSGQ